MKIHTLTLTLALTLSSLGTPSTEAEKVEAYQKVNNGARELSLDQDNLSADVQDLIDEQSNTKVIELLDQVEVIMGETIDRLEKKDVGGETIAAQTEIIELIFEAAKKKQESSSSPGSGAMMDMMGRMMGKGPGDKPGNMPGQGKGDKPGEGSTGDTDLANEAIDGANDGKNSERVIPKTAGKAGKNLPSEFQKALDAYNK